MLCIIELFYLDLFTTGKYFRFCKVTDFDQSEEKVYYINVSNLTVSVVLSGT